MYDRKLALISMAYATCEQNRNFKSYFFFLEIQSLTACLLASGNFIVNDIHCVSEKRTNFDTV